MSKRNSTRTRQPIQITGDIAGIILTRGKIALVDCQYIAYLVQWNWTARVCRSGNIYAYRQQMINGKMCAIHLHHVILSKTMGRELQPFPVEQVDHIDGNGLNNIITNLRLATPSENNCNQRRNSRNTSGYKGVYWHKKNSKWIAQIKHHGHRTYIGSYDIPEAAHEAYCIKAKELFGEYARIDNA